MKAPQPEDEALRLFSLHEYEILDTLPESAYDDLTRLAATICGTPIAMISLIDKDRQWFKSRYGMSLEETSRDISFCAHAILEPKPMIVPDTLADPRFADNPLVQTELQVRFYAGTPLITSEGAALGTLCVVDRLPRELTPEQIDALEIIGRQVMAQLELRRSITDLVRTITSRNGAEDMLDRLISQESKKTEALQARRNTTLTWVGVGAILGGVLALASRSRG